MENTPSAALSQARHSMPKDFAQDDPRPAPLRLSPKDKHALDEPDTLPEQLCEPKPQRPGQESKKAGALAFSLSTQSTKSLASIVSKFEILDGTTSLEVRAAAGPEIVDTGTSRSSARGSLIRSNGRQDGQINNIEDSAFGDGRIKHEQPISTSSSSQTSSRRGPFGIPRDSQCFRKQSTAETIVYTFDVFTGERQPVTTHTVTSGSNKSLVAERRQIFESAAGTIDIPGNTKPPPMLVEMQMPLSFLSSQQACRRQNTGAVRSPPQTPSPERQSRFRAWQTVSNGATLRQNDSRAPENRTHEEQPRRGWKEPNPIHPTAWTRSVSKTIGNKLGQIVLSISENLQKKKLSIPKRYKSRREMSALWPRAMDALHSRDSSGCESPELVPEINTYLQEHPVTRTPLLTRKQSRRLSELNAYTIPRPNTDIQSHGRHTTSESLGLTLSPTKVEGKAPQNRVVTLRKLFDRSSKDGGSQGGSQLRRCHTGPRKKTPTITGPNGASWPDNGRAFQARASLEVLPERRSLQMSTDIRVSNETTHSSLKDCINAYESICRPNIETTALAHGKASVRRMHKQTRGVDLETSLLESRFNSLGFKRGREAWRKISASWEKNTSHDDDASNGDESGRKGLAMIRTGVLHARQGSYLSAGHKNESQPLSKTAGGLDDIPLPSEFSSRYISEPPATARTKNLSTRRSMPAIIRKHRNEVPHLDGVHQRRNTALPISTTGPVIGSSWCRA
ncbi:hypothetical protein CH63R_09417 [Colletotrichum higginsianum IMI 349063]|uniref:Uncharacterized protein n=1 Tax=Colletotrichum higginsianum (strain IMI 349063) TaxID=759273 RepID=A0A1B7Y785_COLHI|nr:hypothetical protein CH63R_09417 [Colletotrichum higginsianum IMI 349063]OBR07896.1 hypothetical protein CH63R_09417 [Colletotrichum higginsianum IMI 349063]